MNYSNYHYERSGDMRIADWNSDWTQEDENRDRICVNFLRHEATNYDYILTELSGRVGRNEAHKIVFRKFIESVIESYPSLYEAAVAQFKKKFGSEP